MPLKGECNAPWFELNILPQDDQVATCCFYTGQTDGWTNPALPLDKIWNSESIRRIRRINNGSGDVPEKTGCSNCYYFDRRPPDAFYCAEIFQDTALLATQAQRENHKLAMQEYQAGVERVTATPLRFYFNFGFTCNLSCAQCHQVPRRDIEARKTIDADGVLGWRSAFPRAMDVLVIGGEPFALPEALKFIRGFINDPGLEATQLTILTNGSLLHKHMALLKQKDRLSLGISLDGFAGSYERIRLGGDWKQLKSNIEECAAHARAADNHWKITIAASLMATGLPDLPAMAHWMVQNDLDVTFFEIISAPGVERVASRENFLSNPNILSSIPSWERYFDQAEMIFRNAQRRKDLDMLRFFHERARSTLDAKHSAAAHYTRNHAEVRWIPVAALPAAPMEGGLRLYSRDKTALAIVDSSAEREPQLIPSHPYDHLYSQFYSALRGRDDGYGLLRIDIDWGETSARAADRRAYLGVEDQTHGALFATNQSRYEHGRETLFFDLSDGIEKFRIILNGEPHKRNRLPQTIELALGAP